MSSLLCTQSEIRIIEPIIIHNILTLVSPKLHREANIIDNQYYLLVFTAAACLITSPEVTSSSALPCNDSFSALFCAQHLVGITCSFVE